jgi:hypothetical protein
VYPKGPAEIQSDALKEVSSSIWKASCKFDVDESANDTRSKLDFLVRENVIQKALESDDIVFVEGAHFRNNPDFLEENEK